MKNIELHYGDIEKRIATYDGCLLMLDFDGTLSPIAETPEKAILPQSTKRILKTLATHLPLAIVSGRSLDSIKGKVGLNHLIYAGSHGMEWEIDGRVGHFKIPKETLGKIQSLKLDLEKFLPEFKGMLIEDKRLSLAIHYRLVRPIELEDFQLKILRTISPLLDKGFELIRGKKVFELRPKIDWTKGHFAEFAIFHREHGLKKRLLPIYVGDDTTDEDVFRRFPDAITVRVGKKAGSAAKYYLEDQGKIDGFLEWISKKA